MTTTTTSEYRVIQSRTTGERWILHPASMTCGTLTDADLAEALDTSVRLFSFACDDEADDWMLDDTQVRVLRVEL